jgi:ATP-dependent Lhr-like helicase
LHPSGSDETQSFERLHPLIRRWIWEQKWEELRDVQDKAIRAVLDSSGDVVVAASTAAGKTEAAFLPILTTVADRTESGLSVLYISPLKALINDQFRRLEQLCERMEIDVVRWHGDAPQSGKAKTRRNPRGVALITPESIEAMLVRRPGDAHAMLSSVDFIVIDELHAFLRGPRGLHLASLLRRIDEFSLKRARRVGLSATLGDLSIACQWLNPQRPQSVLIVESSSDAPELRLQVRAYLDPEDLADPDGLESDQGEPNALDHIADHMYPTLRGANNLVFAGSRRRVEAMADRLRRRCEAAGVPNEFFPHHGSLSKGLREELEERLKNGNLPTTAVATTTLELGIDIGSVKSVAQVGAPRSLSSLRQRLGRSGRRKGAPAILRIYVRERNLAADSDPLDHLRLEVIRAVASVRLLMKKFVEPPSVDPSIATVALHQTLAIITERGGSRADRLYGTICGFGPLSALGRADYVELLRSMASQESRLIEQAPDGTIMLGEEGEFVAGARDFYAIFPRDDEWRLVTSGRTLGTIPLSNAVGVGSLVAFAGQRWRVAAVDDRSKVLEVEFHRSGQIPKFDSLLNEPVHDRLIAEMRSVFIADDAPPFLDATAQGLLAEGRAAFHKLGLANGHFLPCGSDTHVLLWRGTQMNSVFAIAMAAAGLECVVHDIGVSVTETEPDAVKAIVGQIAENPPAVEDLADFVGNLRVAKYDELVPAPLLRRLWARANSESADQLQAQAAALLVG